MSDIVSIIIPVYNVDNYIHRCLDSVINQTYQNIEIILVDDGSKDNSGNICDNYAQKDNRIKVFHKQNEGVSQARIDGVEYSSGELIAFIDADDYVTENYVEQLYYTFSKYNVDLVCSQCYFDFGDRLEKDNRRIFGFYEGKNLENLLGSTFLFDPTIGKAGVSVFLWSKLLKRRVLLDSLKYGKGIWHEEDLVCIVDIVYSKVKSIYILPDAFYYYVQHREQVTKKVRLDLWNNQCIVWNRLKNIDTRSLFKEQLMFRIWMQIKLYQKAIISQYTFRYFIHSCKRIRNSVEVLFFFNEFAKYVRERNNKIYFYLLKYRAYILLYLFLQRYIVLNKLIKLKKIIIWRR